MNRGSPVIVFRNLAAIFEVTREKKVVWKWDDHALIKSLTTLRALGE